MKERKGKLVGRVVMLAVICASAVAALMAIIGIIEIISERIAKLDRILPRKRVIRGFGMLTAGGITGIPLSAAGIILKINGDLPLWMMAGAVLCAVFAGLLYKGYHRKKGS